LWSVSKALGIPLDPEVKRLDKTPYTISFIVRKRQQIDNLNEIPRDKRPPEQMIWEGTSEELDDWIDRVFKTKEKESSTNIVIEDIEE